MSFADSFADLGFNGPVDSTGADNFYKLNELRGNDTDNSQLQTQYIQGLRQQKMRASNGNMSDQSQMTSQTQQSCGCMPIVNGVPQTQTQTQTQTDSSSSSSGSSSIPTSQIPQSQSQGQAQGQVQSDSSMNTQSSNSSVKDCGNYMCAGQLGIGNYVSDDYQFNSSDNRRDNVRIQRVAENNNFESRPNYY